MQHERLVVLDAAAFDVLHTSTGEGLRAHLRTAARAGTEVRCAAVTLAEVCRGRARTRGIEAVLRRDLGGFHIRVVHTDEDLAKCVGQLLTEARRDSCHLADAHVVALCADADQAMVITSDAQDINHLAASVPGVRIVTRRP